MKDLSWGNAVWGRPGSWLQHWPVIALVGLASFALLGASSKQFANALYILCLVPALISWSSTFAFARKEPVFCALLLVYCGYCALVSGVLHEEGARELKYYCLLLLFFGFLGGGVASEKALVLFMRLLLALCAILLAYGLIVHLSGERAGRFQFGEINANRASVIFAFAFSGLMWTGARMEGWRALVAVSVAVAAFLAVFYLLESRSLLICLMVFTVMALVLPNWEVSWKGIALFAVIFAALSLIVVFCEPIYQRLVERGGSYRLQIWSDVWGYMQANDCYLLGCGKDMEYRFLGRFDSPHGLWMSVFFYYGAIGLLLLLAFLAYCAYRLSGFYLAWLFAFLAFCTFTHTRLIDSPSLLWLYFWTPLVLGLRRGGKGGAYA